MVKQHGMRERHVSYEYHIYVCYLCGKLKVTLTVTPYPKRVLTCLCSPPPGSSSVETVPRQVWSTSADIVESSTKKASCMTALALSVLSSEKISACSPAFGCGELKS